MIHIAAILTCFNRREKTLAALRSLQLQHRLADAELSIFLTDDASSDGTSEAVQRAFPHVHLLQGDGRLFWNGGMRRAMDAAARSDPDYYLWLNDDTHLDPDAVARLLEVARRAEDRAIAVGATRDPDTGLLTYGGVNRGGWSRPVTFRLLPESETVTACDTMNGNCVLISRKIYTRVGGISSAYSHAMGDMDYGLRARRNGFEVLVAPGTIGACARNPGQPKWRTGEVGIADRFRAMRHQKGLPMGEWRAFTSAHAGPLWFIYWLWPYVRTMLVHTKREQVQST